MSTIGHRGAAGYATENTLLAIKKALELRVDMIELDVRRCASGELVVFHDAKVSRITNGKGVIQKMTLAEIKQLRTLDGQEILTLDEALDAIDGRCWVNLDLKSTHISRTLVALLQQRALTKKWRLRQFLISSFHHGELQRVKQLEPKLKIGLLYYRSIWRVLTKAKKMSAYSVHFHVLHLKKQMIDALHHNGIKAFAWTVNNAPEARRLHELDIDGMISDFPDAIQSL